MGQSKCQFCPIIKLVIPDPQTCPTLTTTSPIASNTACSLWGAEPHKRWLMVPLGNKCVITNKYFPHGNKVQPQFVPNKRLMQAFYNRHGCHHAQQFCHFINPGRPYNLHHNTQSSSSSSSLLLSTPSTPDESEGDITSKPSKQSALCVYSLKSIRR